MQQSVELYGKKVLPMPSVVFWVCALYSSCLEWLKNSLWSPKCPILFQYTHTYTDHGFQPHKPPNKNHFCCHWISHSPKTEKTNVRVLPKFTQSYLKFINSVSERYQMILEEVSNSFPKMLLFTLWRNRLAWPPSNYS